MRKGEEGEWQRQKVNTGGKHQDRHNADPAAKVNHRDHFDRALSTDGTAYEGWAQNTALRTPEARTGCEH